MSKDCLKRIEDYLQSIRLESASDFSGLHNPEDFVNGRLFVADHVLQIIKDFVSDDVSVNEELESKIIRHRELCDKLHDLYIKKNHDYGDSFSKSYKEYGFIMSAIRLEDKLRRFKTLSLGSSKVNDESIQDTLIDLANYSLMTILEVEKS